MYIHLQLNALDGRGDTNGVTKSDGRIHAWYYFHVFLGTCAYSTSFQSKPIQHEPLLPLKCSVITPHTILSKLFFRKKLGWEPYSKLQDHHSMACYHGWSSHFKSWPIYCYYL